MVLRDGAQSDGLEVFCVHRHPNLRAWGGAVAFPGGKVEDCDFDPRFDKLTTPVDGRVFGFGEPAPVERAAVIGAVRECFEEACLLPVLGELDQHGVDSLRRDYKGETEFVDRIEDAGLTLDLGRLWPVARWMTPPNQSIRFDARFFVMALPPGQVGSQVGEESLECFWSRPAKILERFERRELDLVPPTQWMLHMLSNFNEISTVRAFVERQSLHVVCPELYSKYGKISLVLPGHANHTVPIPSLEGPTSYDLREGRFVLNLKS
jgi:8-oxo-dGTP pyrophosphatase MutT (NUDIX family)